jgi:hypothetical protein
MGAGGGASGVRWSARVGEAGGQRRPEITRGLAGLIGLSFVMVGGRALAQSPDSSKAPAPLAGTSDSSGSVQGVVTASDEGHPVAYATVTVYPGGQSRFADDSGAFRIARLPPGAYFVRARQIGFAPFDTTVVIEPRGATVRVTLGLRRIAIVLRRVDVVGSRSTSCTTPGLVGQDVDSSLAAIFAEVRKNAERVGMLLDEYPFVYTLERWRVTRSANGSQRTIELDTTAYDSRARRPYRRGAIMFVETDDNGRRRRLMNVPTFRDLADSAFIAAHCFTFVGEDTSAGLPLLRVDFRPPASLGESDVEGSVYLDEQQYVVRRAVFRLTKPQRLDPPLIGLAVTTTFRQIVPSIVVFDEIRSVQPLIGGGVVAAEELDRLLGYRFTHGAPGAR